jgi:DNA primase
MSITDEIKARLDIVDYVQQYVPLKKAGRYYKACCPFHHEKTPSFVVNADTQSWRCFGACAEGGDIFSFAMKQHGWSFSEAIQDLGKRAGVQTEKQSPQQREHSERLDRLRGLLHSTAEFYHQYLTQDPQGASALAYAREKRGFTDETITRFMVGYAPGGWQTMLQALTNLGYSEDDVIDAGVATRNDKGRVYDRFRNRLIIPIRDVRGRVIGFGARALDPDDNPKYLNSPQSEVFDKSRTLFGLDTAKQTIRESGVAVIVEGYMDVVQAQQAGFQNVVAQMGTAMTEAQLKLIAPRWAQTIILALDADAAGQNATMRSLEVARQTLQADYMGRMSVDIRILHIPGAKDPDDLIRESPEQWQALVDGAMPVADFVIAVETASLPEHLQARRGVPVQQRMEIARRVIPLLTASESNVYLKENVQKLAMALLLPEEELIGLSQEETRKRKAQQSERPQRNEPPRDRVPSAHADQDSGPPPLNYDELAPPDEDDDYEGGEVPIQRHELDVRQMQGLTAQKPQVDFSLETYCLRLLLRQPDLMYLANRKFRELAGDHQALLNGPLGDLGVDDFTHTDLRALMQVFKLAVKQHEMDAQAFLYDNLDPVLVRMLDDLLLEEADVVRLGLNSRFDSDAAVSWRQHERKVAAYVDVGAELLDKVLRLRLRRLQRSSQEMQFLQMDAEAEGDEENAMAYIDYMMLTMRARKLIEAELHQNRRLI